MALVLSGAVLAGHSQLGSQAVACKALQAGRSYSRPLGAGRGEHEVRDVGSSGCALHGVRQRVARISVGPVY
jgi:hypothetical protein